MSTESSAAFKCIEVIGQTELFEARPASVDWLPHRRLGRIARSYAPPCESPLEAAPAGDTQADLVELSDFGTAREQYALDDTWTNEQVCAFVELRAALVSSGVPVLMDVGEIVPPEAGAPLAPGMFVPPGHLGALPRIYMVDAWRPGVALDVLLRGAALEPAAARGLLRAMGAAFADIRRWAVSPANRPAGAPAGPRGFVLTPGHLDVRFSLAPDGRVDVLPRFRFVASVDSVGTPPRAGRVGAPLDVLAGHVAALRQLAESDGDASPWIAGVVAACRALSAAPASWPDAMAEVPPATDVERAALAAHARRVGVVRTLDARARAVLAASGATVRTPRWFVRSVPARGAARQPAPPRRSWLARLFGRGAL